MRLLGVKNLLLSMILPAALLSGCSKNDDTGIPNLGIKDNISEVSFLSAGETKTVDIQSNSAWTISKPEAASWLVVTPMNGSGNQQISLKADPNEGAVRKAALTIALVDSPSRFVTLTVTQAGTESGEPIYFENCGTSVEKNAEGYWPYVDQFTGWTRGGTLDQAGVTYNGKSASVRAVGKDYYPGGVDVSGTPFVYMGYSDAYFVIGDVAVGNDTQLILSFYALFQNGYTAGAATFAPVTNQTFKVWAGYDGTSWSELEFTSDGVTNWNLCTAPFGVAAGTSRIYLKFSDFANTGGDTNYQLRLDDFSLSVGGNGEVINPEGPTPPPPPEDYITVKQLRDRYTGSDTPITEDIAVKASIVSDAGATGGNSTSLKNVVISDGEAGIMMRLVENAGADLAFGTEVAVNLNGVTLTEYSGLLQINNVPNGNVSILGSKVLQPTLISAAQLLSGDYESMLVGVQDVQFVDPYGKTAGSADSHISTEVESRGGQTFMMFVSKYAKFISTALPTGSGTLKGVASINNGVYQVLPNTAADFTGMTGERFGQSGDHFYLDGQQTTAAVSVPAAGGQYSVNVHSTVTWSVSTTNAAMISYNPTSGSNDGTITVTVGSAAAARSGELKITTTSSAITDKTLTVTFNQSAPGGGGDYVRVTSLAEITAGGKYILAKDENSVVGNAIDGGYPTGGLQVITSLAGKYDATSDTFASDATVDAYAWETATVANGMSLYNPTFGYLGYDAGTYFAPSQTWTAGGKFTWTPVAGDGAGQFTFQLEDSGTTTVRTILFKNHNGSWRIRPYANSNIGTADYYTLKVYKLQ